MSQSSNPLKQFFRQPAIYLRLPSGGQFWDQHSLENTPNSELPVYPMTAIDEITYRTPDALYNGSAIANVIQSCIPAIKNAWAMPASDMNAILIAIRIASQGHELPIESTCPSCGHQTDYQIDLRTVLDQATLPDYNKTINHGDLEIYFRPLSYHQQNEINMLQFEQQRIVQLLPGAEMPEEDKVNALNAALREITNITVRAIKHAIAAIKTPSALVTEPEFIEEWLKNCDSKLFTIIRDHVIELREHSELEPMNLECPECQHRYKQPFTLDSTSFFAAAS